MSSIKCISPITRRSHYSNKGVKFSNETLFLAACATGDIQECQRLLDSKLVDVNVTTADYLTGLHEATICGNAQLIEHLLNNGADINCCDYEGWTPLHAAASLGKIKIVQLLLEYGADPRRVNCDNLLAYDMARNEDVRNIIGQYLDGQDLDALRNQEICAIQEDIERWLKTGRYEERSHPLTKATVLHVIAAKGYVELLKQILESPILKKQINLEARDNEGFTPLLAASFWSQAEIVEILIDHGACISAHANNGYKINSIHLENYQRNKLNQKPSLKKAGSVSTSIDNTNLDDRSSASATPDSSAANPSPRRSTTPKQRSIDRSDASIKGDNDDYITTNQRQPQPQPQQLGGSLGSLAAPTPSTTKHSKMGQLMKSNSMDIGKQIAAQSAASTLFNSISVDRLLIRSESMTDRELRRIFKELVIEYERLKDQVRTNEEKVLESEQDWIRKERQLQRKVSELEEENRQLEEYKLEIQRLKEENSSLIRVVSKLTKQN